MSFLEDCESSELTKIRGSASLPDEYDQGVWADFSQNCEYLLNEQMQTRRGFARAFRGSLGGSGSFGSITRMLSWITAGLNRLIYYLNNGEGFGRIIIRDLSTGVEIVPFFPGTTAVPETVDLVSQGSTFMTAPLSSDGTALEVPANYPSAAVSDGVSWADRLFAAPLRDSDFGMSFTEPTLGTVSAGAHNFAVVFTTRAGYETRPSPLKADFTSSGGIEDLRPFTFTAAGGLSLQVTITSAFGGWPASYYSVALLMTTVQNPNRYYFVPGVTVPLNPGPSTPLPLVDISDIVLASNASTEAVTATKNYFGLYSQDSASFPTIGSGAGPFSPWKIIIYGTRTVYLCTLLDGTSGMFISNPGAPQWVTLANHLRQLPGKLRITSAFVLRQTLYVLGPEWTYTFSDNGGLPVTWAPPGQVDSHVGTITNYGVDANSSLGYAWVAHDTGLYLFSGGFYAARPATYLNTPDWDRINWAAPVAVIQVKDFPARKMVLVKVPLDGAVVARHIMAIDYSNGTAWDQVNYSLWDFDDAVFNGVGAMELVLNPTKKLYELYASEYVGDPFGFVDVFRSKSVAAGDATAVDLSPLFSDDGDTSAGIDCRYRSCALPKVFREPNQIAAISPRIKGNGTVNVTASTLDHTRTHVLDPITASQAPGTWPINLTDIQTEAVHVEYDNGAVANSWFLISGIKIFWTRWILNR